MIDDTQLRRFEQALTAHAPAYGLDLSPHILKELEAFYALLMRWNGRLHLVAPCSPEDFATRHVLESLLLLPHLPRDATIADVGSGAGFPIIPCMIARDDLTVTLIESSQKKAVFLREALNRTCTSHAASIIARPFEEVETPAVTFITCRALDRFIDKIPALVRWSPPNSTLLFYGGETLREQLHEENLSFTEFLIPLSEKRFLFVVK